MWCPVLNFFQLILGIVSKLILNIVDEGLRIPKVLPEEDFELWPRDWNGALRAAFVLSQSETDDVTEK